jgi:hypothetical protein
MILYIALVLLFAWVLGVLGVIPAGQMTHAPLLVGLLFLLIAFLKARDGAASQPHR